MKRVFLFLMVALMSATLSAQQLYNGGMELWTNPTNPDAWGTWASTIAPLNAALGDSLIRVAMKDSLDFPPGNAHDSTSVRLVVDTCTFPSQGLDTVFGFISYGGAFYNAYPDTPVGLHFGYYPYANTPDSLIFEYKYVPAAGDNGSAYVGMTMNRYDSAMGAEVLYVDTGWLLSATSSWTHVALPLPYLIDRQTDTLKPDSIQIFFISSVAYPLHPGTTLWIDTVHFDASVNILIDSADTTGITTIRNIRGVSAYPDPADAQLNVLVQQAEIGSHIALYDAEGRQVYTATITDSQYIIDTHCLPDGIYSLRVYSTDRLTVYTGRITVVHRE